MLSYGADITMLDKRRRNVLHYLADAFCTEGADAVLEQAKRRSVIALIINQQELYLGAEQCFLVRGICVKLNTFTSILFCIALELKHGA